MFHFTCSLITKVPPKPMMHYPYGDASYFVVDDSPEATSKDF